ncbi:helix-turn-helix domain-containing protein [Streptococcus ovuberis]|uniref:Helix-turn-helix transcriptional regulator n=1 Tax=Streptococcus ovuberis TaxID=1936207 RepID=A0A7X6S2L6_9STRE|nr:helix-turn-helix transcriptional regulator [Streptococcus ovuberis]NKZ21376.1 helix-turn-helix transcriptional regulator [Streptococcus ovuberis]
MNQFAEQLKDFRRQKGLSQDDLANQLHISRQAISRWENGETAPDLDTLVKLSSIFEVTLDELVTGVKPEPVIVQETPMTIWGFLSKSENRWIVITFFVLVFFVIIFFSPAGYN